jgi:hypothetical protein
LLEPASILALLTLAVGHFSLQAILEYFQKSGESF